MCRNCGCELKEVELGTFLHAYDINIGTLDKPYLIKGGVLLSRTTVCCNPELQEVVELVDNQKRIFKKKVL